MPRDGSNNYALPSAPFVTGTVADPAPVNVNFADIATALTDSLTRGETTTFSRALLLATTASAARSTLGATATGGALFIAADQAAARTALGASATGSGVLTAADAAAGRAALGGTATGGAVFTAADQAAGRAALGGTTTGGNVFTAADQAAGRLALGRWWAQVDQVVASAAANVTFTFPAGFRRFRLEIDRGNVSLATSIAIRCGTGGTFDSGASDYSYGFLSHTAGTPISNGVTASFIDLTGPVVAGETRLSLSADIDPGTASLIFQVHSQAGVIESGIPSFRIYSVFGARPPPAVARDQIRVFPVAGGTISGTFTLFGLPA